MSWRCQRSSVSGLIGKTAQAGRASERLSDASSARSARVSFGREVCRRRIASSCRRTRTSTSFERRGRPSSQTSANRFRTTRYTNDQSKTALPRSTTARETNLASRTLRRAAGRVCEPYALALMDVSLMTPMTSAATGLRLFKRRFPEQYASLLADGSADADDYEKVHGSTIDEHAAFTRKKLAQDSRRGGADGPRARGPAIP
jgi:hypothetical protein